MNRKSGSDGLSRQERMRQEEVERQRAFWKSFCYMDRALQGIYFCGGGFDWEASAPRAASPEEVIVLVPQFPDTMREDGGVQRTFHVFLAAMQMDDRFGRIQDRRPSKEVRLVPGMRSVSGLFWVVLKEDLSGVGTKEPVLYPASILAYLLDHAQEIVRMKPSPGFRLVGYQAFNPQSGEYDLEIRFGFDSVSRRFVLEAFDPKEGDSGLKTLVPAKRAPAVP